jgi:hypothetical protein
MAFIWLDRAHTTLRKYTSATTGRKSIVRIELEVTDPTELGFLMRELGEAQARADDARKAEERDRRAAAKTRPKPLAATQPLALPYFGRDEA